MAKKRVPPSYGSYKVIVDVPGGEEWAEEAHEAFDRWTLDMAQNGPSEAVAVLPAFEVVEAADDDPAMLRLTFVGVISESAWPAVEDCIANLRHIAPDLIGEAMALRVGIGAEEVVGREVEIEVDD
jgi:hypothetical protein